MTGEEQTQWLMDRAEITETIFRWLEFVDTKQFAKQLPLVTDDCVIEFPFGTFTIAQLHATADPETGGWGGFTVTHHMLTNLQISIDGASAQAKANVQAQHVRNSADPGTWWTVGGRYTNQLCRTAEGWKLRLHQARVRLGAGSGGPS